MTSRRLLLLLVLVLSATACTRTKYSLRYEPALAEMQATSGPDAPPFARVLVSVRNAFREGPEQEGDFAVHVRLRIENTGEDELLMDLARTQLLDADLVAFAPPNTDQFVNGQGVLRVLPGEQKVYELRFPFPDGREPPDAGLDGLGFQGYLVAQEREIPMSVTFRRIPRTSYYRRDPWYGPYPYGGAYWCGCGAGAFYHPYHANPRHW